ncbi:amidase [Dyella thiooxydans]|uniref:Amidase n=1 Tax=Dyella thiooxydans TaxID=445710 RepID=A0A161IVG7_9GAMM|nr:amidase [Dyella thiooxydans]AND69239.1 amidase [Dyella thiooxydans]
MKTRRDFLTQAPLGLLGAVVAGGAIAQTGENPPATPTTPPPGSPGAFNTAPPVGPKLSTATFAEAEKLMQVTMTEPQRAMAVANWPTSLAGLLERRTGPRKVALEEGLAPATTWFPAMGRAHVGPAHDRFMPSKVAVTPLPAKDEDIAFASVAQLGAWIRTRKLTSTRLTKIYLDRLKRFDPQLRCVITLCEEHALKQAAQADREIAAGKYRGPLHGIPWGAKDLLDTAGIATTYGAEPFKHRVPKDDGAVTRKLNEAGAVLVAKLSLGALALNDIWFGGQTMNPWLPQEGSSGSSAGPASATAAGLVAFAIGSETQGSIISPCMRCGTTGLRPTYGRVPRTGAMTLCWTMDKLGPITRSVEDTMLVLHAIHGTDPGDSASVAAHFDYDAGAPIKGLKVGYLPGWLKEAPATDLDRAALEQLRSLGLVPTEVSLPDWPYDDLNLLLFAEAAAAFEELTLSGEADTMREQTPDAWPNLFRESRFLSAVDFVQADRLRRRVAREMERVMGEVDLLLVPSLRDEMMVISNMTGQPSLTLRTGFVEVSQVRSDWAPNPAHPQPMLAKPHRVPYGVTLVGRLFEEGTLGRVGRALEAKVAVAGERPPGF